MMIENLDSLEKEKFNSLATQWWDVNGACKPLHEINPLRMDFIKKHINLQGKKVLDVGCGGGILTETLAKAGALATGIDASPEVINAAKAHAEKSNLSIGYEITTVETFAKNNLEKFDVITCMELLEHVPDPKSIVLACGELLKPHGQIFFSTLNRNFKSYLYAILCGEYLLKLLPKGTHDYGKFIRPAELDKFARDANLQLIDCIGMTYQPLTGRYHLCKDISVNYLVNYTLTHDN